MSGHLTRWAVAFAVFAGVCAEPLGAQDRLHVLFVKSRFTRPDAPPHDPWSSSNAAEALVRRVVEQWPDTTFRSLDSNAGRPAVLAEVDRLDVRAGRDILMFYYHGHAIHDVMRGHVLTLDNRDSLNRSELRDRLRGRGARLTILMTDCCANVVWPRIAWHMDLPDDPDLVAANLRRLFAHRGLVDVTSARRGESSWHPFRDGGVFTQVFCSAFSSRRMETWRQLMDDVTPRTEQLFAIVREASLPLDKIRQQRTQRPHVFSLPEVSASSPDRPAGVTVVQVHPGTAATKLRLGAQTVQLDRADVILRINGEPVNHPRDAARIIDGLGHGAEFTMVVRDHRTLREHTVTGRLDQGGGHRLGAHVDTNW